MLYNAGRMGSRLLIVIAVLVLVVGAVGRITYERVLNTDTPAYAQDTSSPAPTTTSSPAPTTTSSPAPSSPPPTTTSSPAPTDDRPGDMLDAGGPKHGPVLTMPDGSCLPEYPIKRNGYCYR